MLLPAGQPIQAVFLFKPFIFKVVLAVTSIVFPFKSFGLLILAPFSRLPVKLSIFKLVLFPPIIF
jgi:hypothetical protein